MISSMMIKFTALNLTPPKTRISGNALIVGPSILSSMNPVVNVKGKSVQIVEPFIQRIEFQVYGEVSMKIKTQTKEIVTTRRI